MKVVAMFVAAAAFVGVRSQWDEAVTPCIATLSEAAAVVTSAAGMATDIVPSAAARERFAVKMGGARVNL